MASREERRWEHLIVTLQANAEEQHIYLRQTWPEQTFPIYTHEALIPQLDAFGADGWELVTLEPVVLGSKGDIMVAAVDHNHWTSTYLCTFKRPKPSE